MAFLSHGSDSTWSDSLHTPQILNENHTSFHSTLASVRCVKVSLLEILIHTKMAIHNDVGIGDSVLLDQISVESFVNNLKVR